MIQQAIEKLDLSRILCSAANYRPFPAYGDAAWRALPEETKAYYKGFVQGLSGTDLLAALPATRYMDFARNGNRARYEAIYFQRRVNLLGLCMAECIAGDGALIDDIINLAWAICEESCWVLPAHYKFKFGNNPSPLCDPDDPHMIDLFAAETGSLLSWVYYFLHDEINKHAPQVSRRIEIEIKNRILAPFLTDHSGWWMGLVNDEPVNNWNPWINSNVLVAFLVMEGDPARRIEGVKLGAKSIQRFVDGYFPDGGCDEGPGYFNVAGASLIDYIEELDYATGGALNLYTQPLIANMVQYIARVFIHGDYYVNFADAHARITIASGLLERMGQRLGDESLCRFARHAMATGHTPKSYAVTRHTHYRTIASLLAYQPADAANSPYTAPKGHYFEGIEVMTARKCADDPSGIFVAIKGGHNAESHNHNDIGNFVLYRDGLPVVIDAGVGTYTKVTFSAQRYSLWSMCSDHHNLPDINGCTQFPGRDAAARDVAFATDGNTDTMTMDIAGAYPAEAAVERYTRTLTYDRAAQTVTVRDDYQLSAAKAPLKHYLLCVNQPKPIADGQCDLGGLTLTYDATQFTLQTQPVSLTDPMLVEDWQRDTLYRVILTAKQADVSGAFTLTFS